MYHQADSINVGQCQGSKNWYVGREGVPMNDSSWKECKPVIVFERLDLSVGQ